MNMSSNFIYQKGIPLYQQAELFPPFCQLLTDLHVICLNIVYIEIS